MSKPDKPQPMSLEDAKDMVKWVSTYTGLMRASQLPKIIEAAGVVAIAEMGEKVTRVEVIDKKGRSYVNWDVDNKVELSFQDDGRTLKIFISS